VTHPDTTVGTVGVQAPATGCSEAPGAFSVLLALGALLGFRRRR